MDIDKLEQLTKARKESWTKLLHAIGADNAAREFAKNCREEMYAAAREDEQAAAALNEFIAEQALKPEALKAIGAV